MGAWGPLRSPTPSVSSGQPVGEGWVQSSGDPPALCRRAPVLVALALIESGMKYEDAIQFIRQ